MHQGPGFRRRRAFAEFLHHQSTGGILLFASAVAALVWANGPWKDGYHHLWEHTVTLTFDELTLRGTLHHWINDGLMALFFFVVGLELKREVVGGELSRPRDALLPVAAGLGGMLMPAVLYLAFNHSGAAHAGWGIPMATDIAFAVGVMSLLGDRVPTSLKVFLTTLAIADDLGAVLVIAFFYTSDLSLDNLLIGMAFLAVLWGGNRLGVRNPWFYAVFGIAGMWTAFLLSGIHATIAGVLAAFTIPAETRMDEPAFVARIKRHIAAFADLEPNGKPTLSEDQLTVIRHIEVDCERAATPLQRLEKALHPLVAFGVMPLFALANAGVELPDDPLGALTSPVALGVGVGLAVGKPLGIVLTVLLLVRLGVGRLGNGITRAHLVGMGFLAGIGFTMSLFVNELAFADPVLREEAKLGILLASLVAGSIGFLLLRRLPRSSA